MTKVVFRQQGASILALFPQEPANPDPRYCTCYFHVGQHGAAYCRMVLAHSKPAKPSDYADLLEELKQEYHEITVAQRVTKRDHEIRKQKLQAYLMEGV